MNQIPINWAKVRFNESELSDKAIAAVRAKFADIGQDPSAEHWADLGVIAKTIEGMAQGVIAPDFYISSLPPGIGKTTTLIETVRVLIADDRHRDLGIIIFLSRLEEIETLAEQMEVLEVRNFAALTGDKKINRLGNPNKQNARVLFTTQAMLDAQCRDRKFADIEDFHYRGKPRTVRVWDEAILPSQILTLGRDSISRLVYDLRKINPKMGDEVDTFACKLRDAKDRDLIPVPDISIYNFPPELARERFDGRDKRCYEALYNLSGRVACVRKDANLGVLLHYVDILPDDLAPMLILDASGQQRKTYEFWARDRKGLKFLESHPKSYKGFTIHHWDEGAGKSAQEYRGKQPFIAEGVAKTINANVPDDEECLVIHFLQGDGMPDIVAAIRDRVEGNKDRVKFCNWGRHTATNEFADIKHVFLAGIQEYSEPEYEAVGLAAGKRDIAGELTPDEIDEIRLGEIAHHILQASCRGHVRKSIGAGCPEGCHLYVIYTTQNGIPRQLLSRIFPDATIEDWRPVYRVQGKNQQALVDRLEQLAKADERGILKHHLAEQLGIRANNLNAMLANDNVIGYLKGVGIAYHLTRKALIFVRDPG